MTSVEDLPLWGSTDALATLSELQAAQTALKEYPDVLRTPLLKDWPLCEGQHHVSLKLESLQTTGSFKVRAKLRAQGRACCPLPAHPAPLHIAPPHPPTPHPAWRAGGRSAACATSSTSPTSSSSVPPES